MFVYVLCLRGDLSLAVFVKVHSRDNLHVGGVIDGHSALIGTNREELAIRRVVNSASHLVHGEVRGRGGLVDLDHASFHRVYLRDRDCLVRVSVPYNDLVVLAHSGKVLAVRGRRYAPHLAVKVSTHDWRCELLVVHTVAEGGLLFHGDVVELRASRADNNIARIVRGNRADLVLELSLPYRLEHVVKHADALVIAARNKVLAATNNGLHFLLVNAEDLNGLLALEDVNASIRAADEHLVARECVDCAEVRLRGNALQTVGGLELHSTANEIRKGGGGGREGWREGEQMG